MKKTKNLTVAELKERVKRDGPKVGLQNVRIEGTAVILDKDGNVKSTMKLTNEVNDNAT